jgi:membrane protease YdiL (CAAX protease family)
MGLASYARAPAGGVTEPADGWRPVYAPLALLTGFGASVFGGAFVSLLAALGGASLSHPPSAVELSATLLQDLLFVGAAIFFAARIVAPRPDHFGLRPTPIGRALLLMVGAYAAFAVFTAVWQALSRLNNKEDILQKLGVDKGALSLIVVIALTCVVAPICEEFFFRGFFFPTLSNWRGPWPAAILTGVVFGAIHIGSAPIGDLVPLAFFGIALCLVRWWSGSLYPCIALHAVNNSVAFGLSEHWRGSIAVLLVAVGLAIAAVLLSVARFLPGE